ncbi:hypothetical protein [Wielerella bovis]|uniref:hypothetical protein n=1 Tax=Wielerella bovis TaxID=2917790 RepID=UPI00201976DE|nr:hypothetical protein [Wielerella bovis]MCG7657431.1 hypothetical protein [Wielerella bovis]MCG7659652.1 hypothetical protein [Wielerella bovis]ULJ68606.1 hypothetical protein MIS45_07310 [Wielerella bovis]
MKKINAYQIFRLELFCFSVIICPILFLVMLHSANFSLISLLKAPFTQSRIIEVQEKILVKSSLGKGSGHAFFKYQNNNYRVPCYIEITPYICKPYGKQKELRNIIFLEPYPNSRDVLIVNDVNNLGNNQKFLISKERQISFVKYIMFQYYLIFTLIGLCSVYSILFIIFRRKNL